MLEGWSGLSSRGSNRCVVRHTLEVMLLGIVSGIMKYVRGIV